MTGHDVARFVLDRAKAIKPIFTADEVAAWPEGLLDSLVANGLLKETDNAQSVTCDACGQDHVEKVEYIESPPGAGLRAYISCPENQRVRVPLSRLRRWVVNREKLPVREERKASTEPGGKVSRNKPQNGAPKQSWTQGALDEAIREYKARRASTYGDLVDGVKHGRAGAQKSARESFGRNAIARALGVRSPAMVSNSPVWKEIADQLRLRGPRRSSQKHRPQRIGLDIAVEDQAEATSESVLDQAVRRETIRLVNKSMPATEAEATVEKLQRGDIADDAARELVDLFAQQQQDERTHKVRQDPCPSSHP